MQPAVRRPAAAPRSGLRRARRLPCVSARPQRRASPRRSGAPVRSGERRSRPAPGRAFVRARRSRSSASWAISELSRPCARASCSSVRRDARRRSRRRIAASAAANEIVMPPAATAISVSGLQAEGDPRPGGSDADEERNADQHPAPQSIENGTDERQHRDHGSRDKDDLHDRDELHGVRLRGEGRARGRGRPRLRTGS